MKYSFRQPPGNYKYTLKIFYGGELKEGEIFYRYYEGGEVIGLMNLIQIWRI